MIYINYRRIERIARSEIHWPSTSQHFFLRATCWISPVEEADIFFSRNQNIRTNCQQVACGSILTIGRWRGVVPIEPHGGNLGWSIWYPIWGTP